MDVIDVMNVKAPSFFIIPLVPAPALQPLPLPCFAAKQGREGAGRLIFLLI